MNVPVPPSNAVWFVSVLPEFALLLAGSLVLLLGQSNREAIRRSVPWCALAAIVLSILALRLVVPSFDSQGGNGSGSGLYFDGLADFVRITALMLGVLFVLASWQQPVEEERGEFFSMLLFSLCGLMLVGSSSDLLVLFLALELVSIPAYVLVTLSARSARALEAGTKYFYLGAMTAAVTAYGFSFLFGVSGTMSLPDTARAVVIALSEPDKPAFAVATIGVALSLGGVLFKIAAFPLHFYVADVYQGAAGPVAGFLGFVPKLAGFIAIFKVVELTGWRTNEGGLFWMLWWVAALSMTVGNVLALRQTSIKRMLAYSGVAHSGYMLVALTAGPNAGDSILGDGQAAILFYAVIYGIANLAGFTVLSLLTRRGEPCETVRDVAGLLRRHPGMALLMALAMFTLMGMPPTPGFWGKVSLFGSALTGSQIVSDPRQSWIVALVVIAVINSAVAAAYYLRVVASVLLYENDEPAEMAPREAQHIGAVLCGFLLIIFAITPATLFTAGARASGAVITNAAPAARPIAAGQVPEIRDVAPPN